MASSTRGAADGSGGQRPRGHGSTYKANGLRDTVMRHQRDRSCREMTFKLLDPATKIVRIDAAAVEAADLRHALPKRHYFAPFPLLRLPAASVWYQFNRYGRECGIQAETREDGGILLRHVALKAEDTLALPHVWTWIDPLIFPPDVEADNGAGDEAAANVAADLAWTNWVPQAFLPIAPDPTHILTPKQHKHWLRWLFDDLALLTLNPLSGGIANNPVAVPLAN